VPRLVSSAIAAARAGNGNSLLLFVHHGFDDSPCMMISLESAETRIRDVCVFCML